MKLKKLFATHKRKVILVFVAAFLLRFFLLLMTNWHPDVFNHIDWGIKFWQYGSENFYYNDTWGYTWPNQPPASMYLFALVRKIYEICYDFLWWINIHVPPFPSNLMFWVEQELYPSLLRLPSALFDLGIGWLVYSFIRKEKNQDLALKLAAFWLFNPITFYNSAIWGQTDALINFFGLASILFLINKRPIWAVSLFAISLFFKVSLIIFAPLFLVILFKQKHHWKTLLVAFLLPLSAMILISLPFSTWHFPLIWLPKLYWKKILATQLHLLTANALNFWGFFYTTDWRPDMTNLGPLPIKIWVWVLTLLIYLPVLIVNLKKLTQKRVIFSFFLIALTTFVFMTNMHERYLYPAFPFLVILLAYFPEFLSVYLTLSLLHLINLYNLWWYPRISGVEEFFYASDKIFLRWVAFMITAIGVWSYVNFFKKIKTKQI